MIHGTVFFLWRGVIWIGSAITSGAGVYCFDIHGSGISPLSHFRFLYFNGIEALDEDMIVQYMFHPV
jgi:hypothetical protein